ncbi:MAG: helix-turn-helix transcriptional regulator [Chloroflexota bacterium]|nr:helix-turn-helix transcriptional regulator [Chloroflexota bacterium]
MAGKTRVRGATVDPKLGRHLAALRDERGLAKNEVALRAGIDPSTVTRIEMGERGVSRAVLDRLAAVLDVSNADYQRLLLDANLLSAEAAALVEHEALAQLAAILADPRLTAQHSRLLLQYVELAVAHAGALGYRGQSLDLSQEHEESLAETP